MTVHRADARCLPDPPGDAVHTVAVCSSPYFGLRSYGNDPDEIGAGTLKAYVADMVAVGAGLRRWLGPTGTWWLNLGDTANGSGGAGGDYNAGGSHDGRRRWRQGDTGVKGSQWLGVPWRVAFALADDGWLLRSAITWDKGRVRRGDHDTAHTRRPGLQTEMVFMLAVSKHYRFFAERLAEPGDVWHISANRQRKDSPAAFPDELARRCILASTEPGDRVIDPFAGSGTTVRVAEAEGRVGIGFDLYA